MQETLSKVRYLQLFHIWCYRTKITLVNHSCSLSTLLGTAWKAARTGCFRAAICREFTSADRGASHMEQLARKHGTSLLAGKAAWFSGSLARKFVPYACSTFHYRSCSTSSGAKYRPNLRIQPRALWINHFTKHFWQLTNIKKMS